MIKEENIQTSRLDRISKKFKYVVCPSFISFIRNRSIITCTR